MAMLPLWCSGFAVDRILTKRKTMGKRFVHKELAVELSTKEVNKMAHDLANRQIAFMDLITQHKAIKMAWRDKLAHAQGAIKDLAEGIRDKARLEMIECSEEFDPSSQKIIVTRCDTGERIEFRAASEDEILEYEQDTLQGDLLMDGGDEDAAEG